MFRMKKTCIIGIVILLSIFVCNLNIIGKDNDLFDEIINLTNAKIEEVGVRASFHVVNGDRYTMEDIINGLNINDKGSISYTTDHGHDTVLFSDKNLSGFIDDIKDANGSDIIITLIEKSNYNSIDELKNIVNAAVTPLGKNSEYSLYIKASLSNDNISSTNEQVIDYLKNIGTKNLNTIDINNGFSTVGYTGLFDRINNGGNFIDINFAITNYSSGNYLILGTPTIFMPY